MLCNTAAWDAGPCRQEILSTQAAHFRRRTTSKAKSDTKTATKTAVRAPALIPITPRYYIVAERAAATRRRSTRRQGRWGEPGISIDPAESEWHEKVSRPLAPPSCPEPGRSTTCSPHRTNRHGSTGWTGGRSDHGEGRLADHGGFGPPGAGSPSRGGWGSAAADNCYPRLPAPEAPNLSTPVSPDFGDTGVCQPLIG